MAGLGRRTHYRKHLTDSVLNDFPEPTGKQDRIAKVVAARGGNQFDILVATTTPVESTSSSSSNIRQPPQLAILPTKFHKLVWVKRNDYLIVQTIMDDEEEEHDGNNNDGEEDGGGNDDPTKDEAAVAEIKDANTNNKEISSGGSGIRYMITHILYKEQVKHLKTKGMWPSHDSEFAKETNEEAAASTTAAATSATSSSFRTDDDGIVYHNNHNNNNNTEYDDDEEYDSEQQDENNDDDYFVNPNQVARMTIQDSDSSDDDDE